MTLRPFLLACGVALASGATWANEPAAATDGPSFDDKLAACAACHGENGAKPIMPEYPILAGQHADYLAASLRHYRDGRRNNPIMASQLQALQLTDAEIERLAAHFAAQQSGLTSLPR
ncbi:MAG: cytochrome c [Gammaproteobacteria bacterium]